jgi:DNA-binding Lrp family transcriptional regulator
MSKTDLTLDELDKGIIQNMSRGVYSYEELAEKLHVTRSTIFRRVSKLEETGAITKRIMGFPDYTKLGISAILIGIDIAHEDIAAAIDLLLKQNDVKLIWKTYGRHDMVITMICEKGCEGQAIFDFREKLAKLKITGFDYSIGFSWDKVDFSPY